MSFADTTVRFGPFELLEELGGGMSIVYRARRIDGDGAELAVKVLRKERLLDGEARARFSREMEALLRLAHPSICPLHGAGEIDGIPFLSMPLLQGDTLAARIAAVRARGANAGDLLPGDASGEPVWRRVVGLFVDLADALHVAHEMGFVHRDIKPGNIWVDQRGNGILLDFGLARDRADNCRHLTATGQIVGTPAYLAPEQVDSRFGPVGPRADVHGLAASLFEALTLAPPYTGVTRAELFTHILTGSVVDPCRLQPELPAALGELVRSALRRRQADRCPDARTFANDLRRVLAGEPLSSRRRSWWPRRIAPSRPLVARTVAFGGLAITVALGVPAFRTGVNASTSWAAAMADGERWVGRLALARAAHDRLPPPWPCHIDAHRQWLREFGEPLRQAPAALIAADGDLREFVEVTLPSVEMRLAAAACSLARGVAVDAEAWRRAAAAVAADPRFPGVCLCPQPGLVPIGADPSSKLEEFYDLASGDPSLAVPTRDAGRRLELADRHGIVFVLVPGGLHHRRPTRDEVPLAPFLLAKHELTRAQFCRLAPSKDPSDVPLGMWSGEPQTWRHPVNRVRYADAQRLVRAWGLCLPDVDQWEHAALAGSSDLQPDWPGNYRGAEDGFRRSARVGSYAENAFGLFDMLGNVAEPCTGYSGMQMRGGSYGSVRWRIDGYSVAIPEERNTCHGLRVARALEAP